MRSWFPTSLLVLLLLVFVNACAGDSQPVQQSSATDAGSAPDGTVVIDEFQFALLVGGDAGHGTLRYGDSSYTFKVGGVKLGGIGGQQIHLYGNVYNLDQLNDFDGEYFAAEAGGAVGLGGGGFWLKNGKGVAMHLKATSKGLALSIGIEGIDVSLKDPPLEAEQ